ncbi:MAG: phenylacetic acid degradation protein [Alphaproteobacteria bacterium HGW-Alphaproteobacteria-18]|nr:MAG: phenylacetic acid degradation protein [Alphaproteobacteria bacterium HGW-Alphaproteobacteria-18]
MVFDPVAFFGNEKNAPPVARLLGWQLLEFDQDKFWIKIGFEPKPEFLNPAGFVQGGMLIAMLDDTVGPAVIVASRGQSYTTTIDLHAHFLRPVKLGSIVTEGMVTRLGKTVAFTEGKLFDSEGRLCVRATSSASIGPVPGGIK